MRSKSKSKTVSADNTLRITKARLSGKIEQAIYDYVYETFGHAEAEDPSWYTPDLARYVAHVLSDKTYEAKHRIKYDNN